MTAIRHMIGSPPAQTVSVDVGSQVNAIAYAEGLLSVQLPPGSMQVTYSATGGVKSQIPSGGTTQQFILNGMPGVIMLSWQPSGPFGSSAMIILFPPPPPHIRPIKVQPQPGSSGVVGMSKGEKIAIGLGVGAVLIAGVWWIL